MIDSKFRDHYQSLLINPLLKLSWIQKLKPEMVTFSGLLCGFIVSLFTGAGFPYLAFLMLMLSGFLDTLDGSLARFQNRSSNRGAIFDITADRAVEFMIVLGLYFVDPSSRGLPCLLMLGSILLCITTFLVTGIFTKNSSEKSFHYSPGMIERTEAFLFFGAMILFPKGFVWLAGLFSTLVFYTALSRLVIAESKEVDSK